MRDQEKKPDTKTIPASKWHARPTCDGNPTAQHASSTQAPMAQPQTPQQAPTIASLSSSAQQGGMNGELQYGQRGPKSPAKPFTISWAESQRYSSFFATAKTETHKLGGKTKNHPKDLRHLMMAHQKRRRMDGGRHSRQLHPSRIAKTALSHSCEQPHHHNSSYVTPPPCSGTQRW